MTDALEKVLQAVWRLQHFADTGTYAGNPHADARAIREALASPAQSQVGEWVMVPRAPTLTMQHAYFRVIDKNMDRVQNDLRFGRYDSQKEAYAAMLASAPAQPASVCPYVVTSDEGTSYCRLAESAGPAPGAAVPVAYRYSQNEASRNILPTKWQDGTPDELSHRLASELGVTIEYAYLAPPPADLSSRERKELELRREQMSRMPFCPDHRDKVRGLSCRQCEIERLEAALSRVCAERVCVCYPGIRPNYKFCPNCAGRITPANGGEG